MQKWLEKTEQIIKHKPKNNDFCKIVAGISTPDFWKSQIIVFYDEEYYNSFFDRQTAYQRWTPIKNRSFIKERNIKCDLIEKGYIEILKDEDYSRKSELWFYGEL